MKLGNVVLDGLTDAYDNIHMGNCAEICATKHHITREDQDAFAAESYRRAVKAIDSGVFDQEIVPVTIENKRKRQSFLPMKNHIVVTSINYPNYEQRLSKKEQ